MLQGVKRVEEQVSAGYLNYSLPPLQFITPEDWINPRTARFAGFFMSH